MSAEHQQGGHPPLGATCDGRGVRFAVYAGDATRVELCLFDAGAAHESRRVTLPERSGGVFHGFVPDVGPGQRYGYRAHGPYAPERGARYNPHKLLIDPYARAVDRPARWHASLAGYAGDDAHGVELDTRDSAEFAPRAVVIDPAFDWQDDQPPGTAWRDTLIYECHVKGLTALHPQVPEALRGRYLGLASLPVLSHLRALGVTAVELMPVAHTYHERFLVERGMSNYWGYNSIAFSAPDCRFASGAGGEQVHEFKSMVRALHRVGIEVILDVVYNHSGEADALGPTLSLRGLCNAGYYQLDAHDARRYVDFTGCGNTLDLRNPYTSRLVLDSLRYWAEEMHVDGFRFDLAPALARSAEGCDVSAGLFAAIERDPTLRELKLIVEPWDCAGVARGEFTPPYAEWNDRYRDCVRRFWRGDGGQVAELATRLAGSSDVYAHAGSGTAPALRGGARSRAPCASIHFVTCHDGFTLRDLTSYADPHNLENGWEGRDGTRDNASRNWGAEGPSEDARIEALRDRVARSMLATLACSLGVPMLLAGDEMGRSQRGNNNPYAHDSEISWLRWDIGPREQALIEHVQRCFALRHAIDAFRRPEYYHGVRVPGAAPHDVTWLGQDGQELRAHEWHEHDRRVLGMWVCGHDREGKPDPVQPSCVLALNGGEHAVDFVLPALPGERWTILLDSADVTRACRVLDAARVDLQPQTLLLLRSKRDQSR